MKKINNNGSERKHEKVSTSKFNESSACISICLKKFLEGLSLDFVIREEENKCYKNFIVLLMNDKPVAYYDVNYSKEFHPEYELITEIYEKLLGKDNIEKLKQKNGKQ